MVSGRIAPGVFFLVAALLLPLLGCADDPTASAVDLPVVGTLGSAPSDLDLLLEIDVDRSGHVLLAGEEMGTPIDLREALFAAADPHRDLEDLSQPSVVHLLIRADRGAPWEVIQWIRQAAAYPSVRINRVLFAVRGEAGEERTFAIYHTREHGLFINWRMETKLDLQRVGLELGPEGDLDPHSFHAALIAGRGEGIPIAAVRVAPAVPLDAVLAVVDILVRTGFEHVHFWPTRAPDSGTSFHARTAELLAERGESEVRLTLDGVGVPSVPADAAPLPPGQRSSKVEGITDPWYHGLLWGPIGILEDED